MSGSEGNERLDRLFAEVDAILPACDKEHVRAHAYRLLRQLSALERRGSIEVSMDPDVQLAQRASDYMDAHLAERLTVEEVAAACNVSSTALKQAFRTVVGVPPATWLRQRRIDEAQRLLMETDLTVAQVAASVGYANPSKFSHAFGAQMGESPSSWRLAHQ